MNIDYRMPTRLVIGAGKFRELHKMELPGKKALIVAYGSQSKTTKKYLPPLQEELDAAGISYVVYDKILSNPIKKHVMEGAQLAKEAGCDFIIGLGGGSSTDSAKAISVMAANEGDYWDYVVGGSAKGLPIPNKPLPVVAISTTSGTGTEADPWTVVTNEATDEKIGFGTADTFPALSIIDPCLTLSVPPMLTAFQGFDVFFHNAEGYVCNAATPLADCYSLPAIELIGKYLPKAVADGSDLEARTQVALANILGGFIQVASSCAAEHSIAHAIGAFFPQIQHGAALIMISKAYFSRYARLKIREERLIRMAQALGNKGATKPEDFVDSLEQLKRDCGVGDLKMSDFGIQKKDLPALAKNAIFTMGGLFEHEPVPLSEADCIQLLEESYR